MKVTWWLGTLGMMGLRAWLLVVIVQRGGPLNIGLGGLELIALTLGAVNLCVSVARDYSFRGTCVSLCYILGVILFPTLPGASLAGAVFMVAGLAVSTWALFCMLSRFTVGGSSWVSLCNFGPYSVIRHPQLLGRLCMAVGGLLCWPGVTGGLRLLLCIVLTLSVMYAEERYLLTIPAWAEYAERVRARFIPGVV